MVDTDFERTMQVNAAPLDEYLSHLIAKASPQWRGVDVDAFMDMVRGRKPEIITEHLASVSEDWAVVLDTSPPSNHSGDLIVDFTVLNPCKWNPQKEPNPFRVLSVDSVPFDVNRINDPDFDPFGFKETSP